MPTLRLPSDMRSPATPTDELSPAVIRDLPGFAQASSDTRRSDKIRTQQTVMCKDFIHEGDQ
jgi:hypothetical protein